MTDLATLTRLLQSNRFPLTDEKRTQSEIEATLLAAGIAFEREVRLSSKDIVDFMVEGGIAVEIKIKGQARSIYRQLMRYAEHPAVEQILLATSVSMHLPSTIEGKPAKVASLSQGWL